MVWCWRYFICAWYHTLNKWGCPLRIWPAGAVLFEDLFCSGQPNVAALSQNAALVEQRWWSWTSRDSTLFSIALGELMCSVQVSMSFTCCVLASLTGSAEWKDHRTATHCPVLAPLSQNNWCCCCLLSINKSSSRECCLILVGHMSDCFSSF